MKIGKIKFGKDEKIMGKIIVGGLIVAAGIGGYSISPIHNKVYSGTIDDSKVRYYEYPGLEDLHSNVLVIEKDGNKYVFRDTDRPDPINVGNRTAPQNSLENITIYGGTGTSQKFRIDQENTEKVFDKGNRMYNDLRTKIVNKIYQKKLNKENEKINRGIESLNDLESELGE
ncbi:hypothetical protein K8R47_04160 [archaeon]|nr:hypothetical protein [archaeon]